MLLAELNWPQVNAIAKELPVVIPIAAVEQHGRHLPVFTDSMLLGEVVRRAALVLGDRGSGRRSYGWGTRTITSTLPARCPRPRAPISTFWGTSSTT